MTNLFKYLITILRMAIGWHLFYEGISKVLAVNWSAFHYLAGTSSFLSPFYHFLASTPALLQVVDMINMYGLTLAGLALITGFAIRYAASFGVLLLTLYYFAYPPFGNSAISSTQGHLYIVDKNFIEVLALLMLMVLREKGYGIYALKRRLDGCETNKAIIDTPSEAANSRREALKNLAALPVLGAMGFGALNMHSKYGVDVMSGATIQLDAAKLSDLKGELPKGKILQHEISRLIIGGNLIVGFAHARDLIYVSSLFKAYNTEQKVYETLMLAENAGINTINVSFRVLPVVTKYKKMTGSKIKIISQVAPDIRSGDIYAEISPAIDQGADFLQIHGDFTDTLARDGQTDIIYKMLERIRENGKTAGLASHTIDSLIICKDEGIVPDYYFKTMHHDNYWSAHPREFRKPYEVSGKKNKEHHLFHDNCFCLFPEKTVDFVNDTTVPVIGFKVLAAGALKPDDGFKWAFENGADFICVGMFDFQVVKDVNTTIEVLNNLQNRKRQWYS